MINFTIDRIPLKIEPCPIIDVVFEIRYVSNVPLEIMVGLIYEKLQSKVKDSGISLGVLQRLPINDVPLAVRNSDNNLKNQPHYVIDYGGLSVRIAMSNVSVAVKGSYPGWNVFCKDVKDFINVINLVEIINSPSRLGLRYTSFFDFNIFDQTQLKLTIFDNDTLQCNNAVFINWDDGDKSCSLQVANNVQVANSQIGIKEGSIIDIDVATKSGENIDTSRIEQILKSLHDYEKKVFFNLLAKQFLKTLNPMYTK